MAAHNFNDDGASAQVGLLEISPIGIAILASSGHILYSNPAFGEVIGGTPPELKNKSLAQLAPVAAQNYVHERVVTAARQGGARCKWATEPYEPWVELFIERAIEDRSDFLVVRAWRGPAFAGGGLNGSATKAGAAPEFAVIDSEGAPFADADSIDVSALAAEVADDLRRRTGTAPAIRIQPNMIVRCDPGLFRLVLQHLIDNAIKFVEPGDTARIEIGQSDGVLFVRDSGIGFEPSQASNIFKPFERLPASKAYPGAGIGLASVKRIVERLGGMVWAISKPGRGATFFVRL
ncbi:MAG: ATP-binding protein [Fimbriimonadaceae bacterium]